MIHIMQFGGNATLLYLIQMLILLNYLRVKQHEYLKMIGISVSSYRVVYIFYCLFLVLEKVAPIYLDYCLRLKIARHLKATNRAPHSLAFGINHRNGNGMLVLSMKLNLNGFDMIPIYMFSTNKEKKEEI